MAEQTLPIGPFSAALIVRFRVRYRRSCCRTSRIVGEAVDDPNRTSGLSGIGCDLLSLEN
jgi:hypothetical protein